MAADNDFRDLATAIEDMSKDVLVKKPPKGSGLGQIKLQLNGMELKLNNNGLGLQIDAGSTYIPESRQGILKAITLLQFALEYYPEKEGL